MDENRVLEKRGEDARSAIIERETELERITDAFAEKEKQCEEKWKKEERTRREAEKRAEDLKVVVDRLAMASGEGSGLSPAAALASGAKAGGKTYTQFYTDYTLMEAKLRASENEVSRLTQILDEISADLAEKVSRVSRVPLHGHSKLMSSNLYWMNNRPNEIMLWNELLLSLDNSRPSWLLVMHMNIPSNHFKLRPPRTKRKWSLYVPVPMI